MIGLDRGAMRDVTERIDSALDLMADEFDALDRRVAQLRREWDGAAQAAYTVAHEEWTAGMRELRRIARDLNTVARDSTSAVDEFDRRRAGAWRA